MTISSGAIFTELSNRQRKLPVGLVIKVISNASTTPISGAFANLADGPVIADQSNNYQADYKGGDGNDLTLTVVS